MYKKVWSAQKPPSWQYISTLFQRIRAAWSAEQKFLDFRSEPLRGREKYSEFLSVWRKTEANSRNSILNHSGEKENNSEFRSMAYTLNSICWNKKRPLLWNSAPFLRRQFPWLLGYFWVMRPRNSQPGSSVCISQQNAEALNFKNCVRKDDFWGTDKSFC